MYIFLLGTIIKHTWPFEDDVEENIFEIVGYNYDGFWTPQEYELKDLMNDNNCFCRIDNVNIKPASAQERHRYLLRKFDNVVEG